MRIAEIMTHKVFTVEPQDLIDRVFFLINYEKIRHLPVVEKGKVVGIVSDRDLYKAIGPKSHSNAIDSSSKSHELHVVDTKVQNIMHRGVITTTPETLVAEAAGIMAEHKVGALPVVQDHKLVGIVSTTDLLRVFSRIEQLRENREHRIATGVSHT